MVRKVHELLSECDVLMTFNGNSFDKKHINREIMLAGLTPPAPYQDLDLYLISRKQFRFVSNKLDRIAQELGLEGKVHHSGFSLWKRCLANEPEAWEEMKKYSLRDTDVLIEIHDKILPWISGYPNRTLRDGGKCPKCSSADVMERGHVYTSVSKFRSYQCLKCGAWFRETRRVDGSTLREVA